MRFDVGIYGAGVTVNYEFTLDGRVVMIMLIFILAAVLGSRTDIQMRWSIKRSVALAASLILVGSYITFLQTPLAARAFALDDILFTPNVMYRNNGFTVAFLNNLQYMETKKPEGYSEEKLNEFTSMPEALVDQERRISEYCRCDE